MSCSELLDRVGINILLEDRMDINVDHLVRLRKRQRVLCQFEQPQGRYKLFQSAAPDRSQTVLSSQRWEEIIIELSP